MRCNKEEIIITIVFHVKNPSLGIIFLKRKRKR
jgi:hypothetical protein